MEEEGNRERVFICMGEGKGGGSGKGMGRRGGRREERRGGAEV